MIRISSHKYSKSGARLPATKPEVEKSFLFKKESGKTIPGCEKVKGMWCVAELGL